MIWTLLLKVVLGAVGLVMLAGVISITFWLKADGEGWDGRVRRPRRLRPRARSSGGGAPRESISRRPPTRGPAAAQSGSPLRRGEFAFMVEGRPPGHLHGDHSAARRIEDVDDVRDVIVLLRLNYDRIVSRAPWLDSR